MGRDKALLRVGERTLVERIAHEVKLAAGSVTLIGPPDRYRSLGIPVTGDLVEGCGPLGGLYTALSITQADWNLLVACDLPEIGFVLLEQLLHAAERCGRPALIPATNDGLSSAQRSGARDRGARSEPAPRCALQPLCAVYHRSLLPEVKAAIDHKIFKMHDFVSRIEAARWPAPDASVFANINTPAEWAKYGVHS
jgi:molybdopterin-guanine dinucleotide biosynthesis protein A